MLVDSHCHLDMLADAGNDLDAVIDRAREAGVGTLVTIGTRLARADRPKAIARRYPEVWCSVGTHPHQAGEEPDSPVAAIVDLADDDRVVGIGESGLDYHYDNAPRDVQHAVFRTHIAAARETGLPLIVHTREADEDTVALLREGAEQGGLRGVIHCFSSGRGLAEAAIEMGFMVSLSGILTFNSAKEIQAVAADLPLDRLLVETDAPYLAPVPKRGKPNEPSYVAHTAAFLAKLKGEPVETVTRATTENFFRLFDRAAPPAAA